MQRKILYTTLLGHRLEVTLTSELEKFYDRILAAPSGADAEALAIGAVEGVSHPLTPAGRSPDGLPSWSAATLRDPRWPYLQDAVARCRAAHGELDVGSIMSAATWTVAEAARSLGVSEQTVRTLVRDGDLPAVEVDGRHLIDRRVVEAHATTGTQAGKTARVPALYVRAGTIGAADVQVYVIGSDCRELQGELLASVDGVDELVFPEWHEAVVLFGKGEKCRAVQIRPHHGRAAGKFGLDGLAVVGRVEMIDKSNNRAEAAAMFETFRTAFAAKGARRGK